MLEHKAGHQSTRNGIQTTQADPRVFTRVGNDGEAEIFIVVHVDGILVASRDTATLEGFVVELRRKFAIKDLGDANFYMGCRITRYRDEVIIKFDQNFDVDTVAELYEVAQTSMILAAPGGVPLSKKNNPQTTEEVAEMRGVRYRQATEVLAWESTLA